ncbi:hypothetical protein Y645_08415 [Salmonella enterica subsp. enterica serovar Tennessee]|nr:hypothetical protein Y107_10810 [Salmonella enterica subsp. enterica serovar Tennessee]KZF46389.1 hypothetical protein Y645_08415 [Salmonella enterica subsp. enterica serovar Tennessee]
MFQCAKVLIFWLAFQRHFLFLRLRVFGVQPFSCYTGISSAVGNGKLMTIAVTAGQRHLWNGLTAGRQRTTGFQKQELSRFNRYSRPVAVSQPGKKYRVGFLRLVDMRYRDLFQRIRDAGRQFVTLCNGAYQLTEGGIVP